MTRGGRNALEELQEKKQRQLGSIRHHGGSLVAASEGVLLWDNVLTSTRFHLGQLCLSTGFLGRRPMALICIFTHTLQGDSNHMKFLRNTQDNKRAHPRVASV